MSVSLDFAPLDAAAARLGCQVLRDEPLAPRTTFKIGGPADRLVTVDSPTQLSRILQVIAGAGLPRLIIGKGSDLLVGDRGFRGAVVCLGSGFKLIERMPDGVTLRAGAAASLAAACAYARNMGLSGLEFAWGIPGSVGGGIYMNAGAYGGELKDIVVSSTHCAPDGQTGEWSNEELGFSYRRSRYTDSDKVIAFAELRLTPGDPADIGAKMEELMARRKQKQPYDLPSGGSAFKRPAAGYAAELIERCGLKGRSVGGAQVSEKHAGFIVNTGGASCRDVMDLMDLVRETVRAQTGIELEPELRLVGEI